MYRWYVNYDNSILRPNLQLSWYLIFPFLFSSVNFWNQTFRDPGEFVFVSVAWSLKTIQPTKPWVETTLLFECPSWSTTWRSCSSLCFAFNLCIFVEKKWRQKKVSQWYMDMISYNWWFDACSQYLEASSLPCWWNSCHSCCQGFQTATWRSAWKKSSQDLVQWLGSPHL